MIDLLHSELRTDISNAHLGNQPPIGSVMGHHVFDLEFEKVNLLNETLIKNVRLTHEFSPPDRRFESLSESYLMATPLVAGPRNQSSQKGKAQ